MSKHSTLWIPHSFSGNTFSRDSHKHMTFTVSPGCWPSLSSTLRRQELRLYICSQNTSACFSHSWSHMEYLVPAFFTHSHFADQRSKGQRGLDFCLTCIEKKRLNCRARLSFSLSLSLSHNEHYHYHLHLFISWRQTIYTVWILYFWFLRVSILNDPRSKYRH